MFTVPSSCYDKQKPSSTYCRSRQNFYTVLLDAWAPSLNRREIKYISFIWEQRKRRRMTQLYNTDVGEDATLADVKENGRMNSESLLAAYILTVNKKKGKNCRFAREIIPYGQCGKINLLESSIATRGFARNFMVSSPRGRLCMAR